MDGSNRNVMKARDVDQACAFSDVPSSSSCLKYNEPDEDMVLCNQCDEWYHYQCEYIDNETANTFV